MRQFILTSLAAVVGIVAGVGGTWLFWNGTIAPGVPDQAAMINVRPPSYVEEGIERSLGVDGVWEREIKNHAFRLQMDAPGLVLRDPDVMKTRWYGSFADPDRRRRALEEHLHVQHVPETSYLLVWFDGSPESETAIIGNTVVRGYLSMVKREVTSAKVDALSELSQSMQRRLLDVEDIALELDRIKDQSRVEALKLEQKSLREQRLALGVEIEQVKRRLDAGDYFPLEIIRVGSSPVDS